MTQIKEFELIMRNKFGQHTLEVIIDGENQGTFGTPIIAEGSNPRWARYKFVRDERK